MRYYLKLMLYIMGKSVPFKGGLYIFEGHPASLRQKRDFLQGIVEGFVQQLKLMRWISYSWIVCTYNFDPLPYDSNLMDFWEKESMCLKVQFVRIWFNFI